MLSTFYDIFIFCNVNKKIEEREKKERTEREKGK